MAIKSKFSSKEWQMITDGPEWVFAALAAADGNVAIMTKTKESKAFKNIVKTYSSSSPLVKEVQDDKTKASREIKGATLSDAEQALEEINEVLEAKLSRSEADLYRAFLKDVGESVAEAAGEGVFGAGKKVSEKEAKALTKIKSALKPSKAPKVDAKPVAKPVEKPKAKPKPQPAPRPSTKPTAKPKQAAQKPSPRPFAATPTIPSQAPMKKEEYLAEHTVVSGETLSHIALKYYNSAVKAKYMVIYEANKDVIGDNPNLIKPGMVLKIPKLDE
jgi:nucleoid-associated protein YgaU